MEESNADIATTYGARVARVDSDNSVGNVPGIERYKQSESSGKIQRTIAWVESLFNRKRQEKAAKDAEFSEVARKQGLINNGGPLGQRIEKNLENEPIQLKPQDQKKAA